MYAIIQTGAQQYRVKEGDVVRVAKIAADEGSTVDIEKVLFLSDGDSVTVGVPFIEGAKINAEIVRHGRGKKIKIIKFRRRKHHMKTQGHRQDFTEIKITGIRK